MERVEKNQEGTFLYLNRSDPRTLIMEGDTPEIIHCMLQFENEEKNTTGLSIIKNISFEIRIEGLEQQVYDFLLLLEKQKYIASAADLCPAIEEYMCYKLIRNERLAIPFNKRVGVVILTTSEHANLINTECSESGSFYPQIVKSGLIISHKIKSLRLEIQGHEEALNKIQNKLNSYLKHQNRSRLFKVVSAPELPRKNNCNNPSNPESTTKKTKFVRSYSY